MLQFSDTSITKESQLEQELRQMFELDSQQDLETYFTCAGQLQTESWVGDMQKMYRAIHTIKGGAVTVRADATLNVAMALEELLSDLRYLEVAPPLEDGHLIQILLEGGEILASAMAVPEGGEKATAALEPKVERIHNLREQIQQNYLRDWSEQAQIQQEFAEEGLELAILDLQIALEQLPETGAVPETAMEVARELLAQLEQIGAELQLASGWTSLLEDASHLLGEADSAVWRSQWPIYFQAWKSCARGGGKIGSGQASPELTSSSLDEIDGLLAGIDGLVEPEPSVSSPPPSPGERKARDTEKVQIPIPLERLEKSAQSVVETLLTARATEGLYRNLHHHLLQLVAIAKDNAHYITQLRQIQDDYALLDNLDRRSPQGQTGPSPERYRKGYITINRLLENSLRLSEIGAEAELTSLATGERLQQLNGSILQLKDTVEDSRLVPFKNLAFRVKAIVRDLIDRSGKPAQLVVRGEEIELDVGTARTLEPLLLHLIRNAYDHGLEMPEERIRSGKPERGTISLSLQRYGPAFLLQVQDDGRGIDAREISQQAERLNLPLKGTATQAELLAVICQPGFSSQAQVSEISGRGVGMDVVANQIASLGGHLNLDTNLGVGTTFYLHFPVPNLLVPCLLLQAGDLTFAVPCEQILTTSLLESLAPTPIAASHSSYTWEIQQGSTAMPALDLLAYWHPQFNSRTLPESAIAVCVKSQQEQSAIWLMADKMLGQSELQIQPLPPPLTAPLGLMGVSLSSTGSLMPVIEINSLIEKFSQAPTNSAGLEQLNSENNDGFAHLMANGSQRQQQSRTILIVDDAALMRRRIEASISACGYNTHTCADGLDAWNWLQTNPNPALLVTDIEMPNLDGFSLISRCRQENLPFPILVISSRLVEEWGREARRVGATDFLTKGFSTAELINRVNALVN